MAEIVKVGSTKRFGARYGRKVKYRFGIIEKEQRKFHKCPYCNAVKVKRVAYGIWQCRKCDAKFTGKAYSVEKKITFEEESKQEEPTKQVIEEVKLKKEEVNE